MGASKRSPAAHQPPLDGTGVTFGAELTIDRAAPAQHWFECQAARDTAIGAIASDLQLKADNREVRVRHLVRLPDGSVYAALGGPVFHEQWRPTVFRASHREYPTYMDQAGIVDVISGRVLIGDAKTPFSNAQYAEYNRERCLEEFEPGISGHAHTARWPTVRPAVDGERAHYVVVRRIDINILRAHTHPEPMTVARHLDTYLAVHGRKKPGHKHKGA